MNGVARRIGRKRMGKSRKEFLNKFSARVAFLGGKGVIMPFWFRTWWGSALHTNIIQERFIFNVFPEFGSGAQDPNKKALLDEGDPLSRLKVALRVVGLVVELPSRDRSNVGPVVAIFVVLGGPAFVNELLGSMTLSP